MEISILGSTGSVGSQTLEVVDNNGSINVFSLIANNSWREMAIQCRKYKPQMVAMFDDTAAKNLKYSIEDLNIKVLSGIDGIIECSSHPRVQTVVSSIVGKAGLIPTYEAIQNKKNIALANKETLVIAGHIITEQAKKHSIELLPVDSEHSAIFQCLRGNSSETINKIILTASGGPFRGMGKDELREVTVQETLKHPNWSMGKKISIDSATLINKGLEAIEAKWLFEVELHKVEIVIHPQSIIHSAVEYIDGNVIAHLSPPDMKYAIEYALNYPHRKISSLKRLSLFDKQLTFEKPDHETFKGLGLCIKAGNKGGSLPVVLNASNEVCVDGFLNKKIRFLEIPEIIEETMELHKFADSPSLDEVLEIDSWAREMTNELIAKRGGK